jgi:hypothetical protein
VKPRVIDTELFIGGHADGRRTATDPDLIITHILRRPVLTDASYQFDRYHRETLTTRKAVFTFWLFEHLPLEDALERLFDNYPAERR